MNNVNLIGNITKEPELKASTNGLAILNFTIGVRRDVKDKSGNYATDFIACVAWRKTAQIIAQYTHKGSPVAIQGKIQTRNYEDKSGVKRYITEVLVDKVQLLYAKNQGQTVPLPASQGAYGGDQPDMPDREFAAAFDTGDDELPF